MEGTPGQRVGDSVRAELARQRKSQRQLAIALGLSQAAVSRRLLGHQAFDVDELAQVAAFLGLPIDHLIPRAAAS